MALRVLTGPAGAEESPDDARLRELYAAPAASWLRVNMVSTVDGAVTGESGRSGSINNAVDKRVFHLLRGMADAVLVGTGTAVAERYRPEAVPTVLVSRRGTLPPLLADGPPGSVLMVTGRRAPGRAETAERLGAGQVLVVGDEVPDLTRLRPALAERGLRDLLGEGGPLLLRSLLEAGVVDELCSTTVPRVIGGDHSRILAGPPVDVPLRLHLLLEGDGTLLARWLVRSSARPGG